MYGKSDYILKKLPDSSAYATLTVLFIARATLLPTFNNFFLLFNYCNNFPSCRTSHQNIKGSEKPGTYKITVLFLETYIA